MIAREIRHFHLFCGLGGAARGFSRGHARVGQMNARFRCLGGVDINEAAVADFESLARAPAPEQTADSGLRSRFSPARPTPRCS